MNYKAGATIKVSRRQFEIAADAAMDMAAVALGQVYRDDLCERAKLEAMLELVTDLIYELPPLYVGKLVRLRGLVTWQIGHDDSENAKHRQQLEGGQTWANALDQWAGNETAAVVCETTAA